MSLDIFFTEDVAARLEALRSAAAHYNDSEFRRGWLMALDAVGAAFGCPPEAIEVRSSKTVPPKQIEGE